MAVHRDGVTCGSGSSRRLRAALCLACLLAIAAVAARTADAAPSLTVEPITWNVVGLDSNLVTAGPNTFLVGTRVCNTGTSAATNVVASFVWDSANAFVALGDSTTRSVGTLAAATCTDVYFTAVVTRSAAAYNTARRFHVEVTADTLATVSTPTPRELYVEKLVSQGRNSVGTFTGPSTVRVGGTVTYTVTTTTATQGYSQLVTETLWPTSMFRIVSATSTYTAPSGATNDRLYADACGWDTVPTSGTYRSCIGPDNYTGGKAGGTIVTTYTLAVVGAGVATVKTMIYDFSGSSYHYNSDFDTSGHSITAVADTPPVAVNDVASTSPSTPVAVSVLTNDTDADGDTLTVTGSTSPANGSASCSTTQCTYTPTAGFTGIDTFTYTISDGFGGTATATVTVTVATVVPAFWLDSPLPVVLLVVGLGVASLVRRRRRA